MKMMATIMTVIIMAIGNEVKNVAFVTFYYDWCNCALVGSSLPDIVPCVIWNSFKKTVAEVVGLPGETCVACPSLHEWKSHCPFNSIYSCRFVLLKTLKKYEPWLKMCWRLMPSYHQPQKRQPSLIVGIILAYKKQFLLCFQPFCFLCKNEWLDQVTF